jgi:hypothetical protein
VTDPLTGSLVSFGEVEEAALFEDAELRPRPAPTLRTRERTPIVPPLRAFEAQFANTNGPAHAHS